MPTEDYSLGFVHGYEAAIKKYAEADRMGLHNPIEEVAALAPTPSSTVKKKRKPSKYNRVYSKHYKRLAKKHPRSSFASISKKAHRAARKELK
tara:strand:+ start:1902 stop:2180 length:279 start_codon:yes stop_codon:yes gene_type:complete